MYASNIFSRLAQAGLLATIGNSFSKLIKGTKIAALVPLCGALAFSQVQHGIVSAYYAGWESQTTPLQVLQKNGSAANLTYLIYAFADIDSSGSCVLNSANGDDVAALHSQFTATNSVNGIADPGSQTALQGNFNQLLELKQKNKNLRVLISVGGESYSGDFQYAAANPANFAKSCVNTFIGGDFSAYNITKKYPNLFDGIDIDWEYPTSTDTVNYNTVLHDLRVQLQAAKSSDAILTAAIGPESNFNGFIDFVGTSTPGVPGAATSVNYFNVMTYNYAGSWNSSPSSNAPLSQIATDINTLIDGRHVASSKIVLGMPFYGVNWSGLSLPSGTSLANLFAADPKLNTDQTGAAVNTNYSSIVSEMFNANMHPGPQVTIYHDSDQSAWAYDAAAGVLRNYDDEQTIAVKTNWAMHRSNTTNAATLPDQLGGTMAWEIGQDANPNNGSLLCAMETAMTESATSVCGTMLYDFQNTSGTGGWIADNTALTLSLSQNEWFSLGKSLRIDIGKTSTEYTNVYATPTANLPAGATVQFHVWVPAGAGLKSIDAFVQSNSQRWGADDKQTTFPTAGWYTFNAVVPANGMEVGLQLDNPTGNAQWTGTIYLDAVVLLP